MTDHTQSTDRPRLLIVDDEAHIRHVLTLKLQNAGYEVIAAQDGESGYQLALEQNPDLIITDYQMPFLDGLAMCRKLKAQPVTSQTPCLMLTARGYRLETREIEQTNIEVVLSKPFSPREVLDRVSSLIGSPADKQSEMPSGP